MNERIKFRDGDTFLIMVKDGKVIHFTPDMALTHVEFVKRTTGTVPEGAWIGTASKLAGRVVPISSKTFYGYQLPASTEIMEAVAKTFE